MSLLAGLANLRRDASLHDLSFAQLSTFTRLLSLLKNDILLQVCQPHNVSTNAPPSFLPPTDDVWALCDTKLTATDLHDPLSTYPTPIVPPSDPLRRPLGCLRIVLGSASVVAVRPCYATPARPPVPHPQRTYARPFRTHLPLCATARVRAEQQ
ncbi:hypothetical protein GGX14DRAFT_576677 [Mycena pura]|uniref:Uncharacterized protein n=1 Tax=Mycena pura TaxID=153505 RepID=A0AAD6UTD0_9AGAR|nr:hypothetical protein GGX14DRAFT_576677 [Mycena pura]